MKNMGHEHSPHCCMIWGILVALFGIFFLVANLMPWYYYDIIAYWPLFLIAAGVIKAACGVYCCKHCKRD